MDTVLLPSAPTASPSRTAVWTGRVVTGLVSAFLLVDALAKVARLDPVVEATTKLGYSADVVRPLGLVLAASTLLHLVPRTAPLGALLVTAYLGGAVDAHVRSGTPFVFAVGMGAALWIAYALRSPSLRAFVRSTLHA